ncbi:MAG: hypothetical protein JW818_13580 [Pirellulales bacterium]|nr:hypothetical protein [Pirellulales bacterium]
MDEQFCCPGSEEPISRAVHLARLTGYDPACRECPHRDQTGTLSPRQVRRLADVPLQPETLDWSGGEGLVGVWPNTLDTPNARQAAAALGMFLRQEKKDNAPPVVLLAGDGGPASFELVAAAGEGLRWTGCHVVDLGRASAGMMGFSVAHFEADGGLLVGSPGRRDHIVAMKFWARGGRPISSGGELEEIEAVFRCPIDRPTRTAGSLKRLDAEPAYLAALAGDYHGLRPLSVVLNAACDPLVDMLDRLSRSSACEISLSSTGGTVVSPVQEGCREGKSTPLTPGPSPKGRGEVSVCNARMHLGIRIDSHGQQCQVWDERGREIDGCVLLRLMASSLSDAGPCRVVVEQADTKAVSALKADGHEVFISAPGPTAMHAAMLAHRAVLGGGSSGRFWHLLQGHPVADALATLTRLLVLLSESDLPLSQRVAKLQVG